MGFAAGIAIGAAMDNNYYYGPYGYHGGPYMLTTTGTISTRTGRTRAKTSTRTARTCAKMPTRIARTHRENASENRSERSTTAQQERTERQQTRQTPEAQAQRDQRKSDAQAKAQSSGASAGTNPDRPAEKGVRPSAHRASAAGRGRTPSRVIRVAARRDPRAVAVNAAGRVAAGAVDAAGGDECCARSWGRAIRPVVQCAPSVQSRSWVETEAMKPGFSRDQRSSVASAAFGAHDRVCLTSAVTLGAAGPRMFATADEAVRALVDAAKASNLDALLGLFGPAGQELISSRFDDGER